MQSMRPLGKIFLSMTAVAFTSLALAGCGDNGEKKPDHPKTEHPAKPEHPKSEHPK